MSPLFAKLLIANRGEIAIRIARAAAASGIGTVAIPPQDAAASLHVRRADEAIALPGQGPAAYLDIGAVIEAARANGCDAIHPGYGFLSENAAFARACRDAGLTFVGPAPEVLELFGDKARARAFAAAQGVPLAAGTNGATDLAEMQEFFRSLGPGAAVMVKAIAGGGGRGMRIVERIDDLPEAFERCRSEAIAAFGSGDLYAERLIRNARHVEVQIIADGKGGVSHLWERECSLQRRQQKLIELAPCPGLDPGLRDRMTAAAVGLASAATYAGLGTFEFLVDTKAGDFVFMEANPRLQVEHTVTEEIFGIDLVRAQIAIAGGATLASLGLRQADLPAPRGQAVQARINMETLLPDGTTLPSGGTISRYEPAAGPGLRVDGYGYAGYRTAVGYDSLLAKLVAHGPDMATAMARLSRGLAETCIEGVGTNIALLQALAAHPAVIAGDVTTHFVQDHLADLAVATDLPTATGLGPDAWPGAHRVAAPMSGRVVRLEVAEGDRIARGQPILIVEAMKMELVVTSDAAGTVLALRVAAGDTVDPGMVVAVLAEGDEGEVAAGAAAVDLDAVRPELAELQERLALTTDAARPGAIAKRHARNQRSARENVADLCDDGSFIEYGALVIPAQRSRRAEDDLIRNTPADGIVTGIGTVNADRFGPEAARCMVLAYDYTVLAGTQGIMSHRKKDRALTLAEEFRLPVVLFAEGGGGRPGDVDALGVSGLESATFWRFARLSGQVPTVGIVAGRCFAGNAALLGCCDVILGVRGASVGMAGPAMIEGGGLGVFSPDEVGPIEVHAANGIADLVVEDEGQAVAIARRYLGYFQGRSSDWRAPDQRMLRHLVPENRLRIYDVRPIVENLADEGSVLELKPGFAPGLVTAFARIEGRPVGILANNPLHLAGAVDAQAAAKAARFIRLCDTFGIPLVALCDTPGFMVGPDEEKRGMVRFAADMFAAAARLRVPFFTVVLRKAYGLGAMAMAGGSTHRSAFTVSWPTGEFGGMGLEGAVRLAYRAELAAAGDAVAAKALFEAKVAELYQNGRALSIATYFEVDAVIDPAETRNWLARGLNAAGTKTAGT